MSLNLEMESTSYYSVLGVSTDSSAQEIKRAYRKLAMQWHPDRWTRTPSLLGEAKRKFQKILEAYSVLSDQRKRALYDAGLYDPEDEVGLFDFVQELVSLMDQTRGEDKNYSLEDVQKMFLEIAQGFESPSWFCGPSISNIPEDSGSCSCSKRTRWEKNPNPTPHGRTSNLYASSGFEMFGSTSGYCN